MNLKLIKILFTILFIGILTNLNASHVRWLYDFDKAHQESLKQKKHLMVLLIKKDSPICKETIINVFMNQPYIDRINKEFIPVLVIKDQKKSYPIELLYTYTYPTLFFLNEYELFSCDPIRGNISSENISNHLKQCK